VVGDWGGMRFSPFRTLVQERVARSMSTHARLFNTHFQIGTGDNFYTTGVRNSQDKRFHVRQI
jgi:hypothetical protein